MHSAINLKQQHQQDSQDKIMTQETQLTMHECKELLLKLHEKLERLELRVKALENPQLMYKPPHSQSYMKISEALDDLYEKIRMMGKYVN